MRLPPMPYSRRRAVCALAREPLAAVRVDQLPRVWGTSEAGAAALLVELSEYNMLRLAPELPPARPRVVLTDFGAEVAGFVRHPGGVRWVKPPDQSVHGCYG